MYDLIGDVHGHADELVALLEQLGYDRRQGYYRHPHRRAIFVGDLIDRGPQIREVLQIVRAMVATQSALIVMGNHEFNALAYHTRCPERPEEFLREHRPKNIRQHWQTLRQLSAAELYDSLEWFRTLPLWLDLDGLRVVHACWDAGAIEAVAAALEKHGGCSTAFLAEASRPDGPLFRAVETLLKGKEVPLPQGTVYRDKDGHERRHARVRWYLSPAGHTYRSYLMPPAEIGDDLPLPDSVAERMVPYPPRDKPVFFGHYWLAAERPSLLAENVSCLDYGVARGGFLCAYRWQGERQLTDEHFTWVAATAQRRDQR